jgi:hypothetical protein
MLLYKSGFSNTENFSLFCIRLGNQEYSRSQLPTKIEKQEDWTKQPKTYVILLRTLKLMTCFFLNAHHLAPYIEHISV